MPDARQDYVLVCQPYLLWEICHPRIVVVAGGILYGKEEEAKCWEAFSAFDKDSSGFIDANELRIVLEMMGQKTTEEEIFRMIAEADAENTGRITYTQLKRVIAEQKKNQSLTNEKQQWVSEHAFMFKIA